MEEPLTRRAFIEGDALVLAYATARDDAPAEAAESGSKAAGFPVGVLEPVPPIRHRPIG